MPLVIAYDDAKNNVIRRSKTSAPIAMFYFPDQPDLPHATLNGHEAGGYFSEAHFHQHDQFQVVTDGQFRMGRHEMTPSRVHFSRAYTPYGPLVSDGPGFAFLVMRTRLDAGSQKLSREMDQLKRVPDRQPFQVSRPVTFPPLESRPASADVLLQEVPGVKDYQGLAGYTLILRPNVKATAPDPSCGDGQYLVVVNGSFWHDNKERKALGLVFVRPDEDAYHIHAGAQGLEALVLNFPQLKPRQPEVKAPARANGFKKWQCALCAFAYDEAVGMPKEGIAAGTRWEDVPEIWSCPDCSSSKSDFRIIEV